MSMIQDYQVGDPRRVLAAAKEAPEQPPTELIWGSQDPDESLRMAHIIVEGGWLAITLSEYGATTYSRYNLVKGTRAMYFVERFSIGSLSQAPMFYGYFLFYLESALEYLNEYPRSEGERLYFRLHGPDEKDRSADDYNLPTMAEIDDTRQCLIRLRVKFPKQEGKIDRMLHALNRQDPRQPVCP